jgi:hypothetical protein
MSRALVDRRWLIPVYRLDTFPIGWECTVCSKLFSISAEEVAKATDLFPPAHVEREFRIHNCELQMRHFPEPDL